MASLSIASNLPRLPSFQITARSSTVRARRTWNRVIIHRAVLCTLALGVHLQAGNDALSVVERAISAAGGMRKIDQFQAVYVRFEGGSFINGVRAPCILESWLQLPDRLKALLHYEYMGKKDLTGKSVHRESYFSDFKIIDRAKQSTKLTIHQDGQKVLETKIVETRFLEKIENSVFGRH